MLLLAIIWAGVFTHPTLPLVSPHPLLQSLGVFTVIQAILLLQPTHTPETKLLGQRGHALLRKCSSSPPRPAPSHLQRYLSISHHPLPIKQAPSPPFPPSSTDPTTTNRCPSSREGGENETDLLSFLLFLAGTVIIEVNKTVKGFDHFRSVHAYLGVATAAVLALQYLFGLTIWAVPRVWGGVDRAKALWKYHRWVGYAALLLLLATVAAAAATEYNRDVLGIKLWSVIVTEVLILAGVLPRVHLRKLGIQRA